MAISLRLGSLFRAIKPRLLHSVRNDKIGVFQSSLYEGVSEKKGYSKQEGRIKNLTKATKMLCIQVRSISIVIHRKG